MHTACRTALLCYFGGAALCGAGLVACLFFGQSSPSTEPESSPPRLRCPASIDLGMRRVGETVGTEVTIANDGSSPLEVSRLTGSCSCLSIGVSAGGGTSEPVKGASFSVPPHSQAKLLISVRVRRSRDPVAVTFETNDPLAPLHELTLAPSAILGVSFSPAELLFTGAIGGHATVRHVDVFYSGGSDVTLEGATCEGGCVSVSAESCHATPGQRPGDPRRVGRLTVTLPVGEPRTLDDTIRVGVRNGSELEYETLKVRAEVTSPTCVVPDVVRLPRASDTGLVWGCLVQVRCNDGAAIRSLAATCDDNLTVTVTEPKVPTSFRFVSVELDNSAAIREKWRAAGDAVERTVHFHVTDETGQVREISLKVIVSAN